MNPGEGVLHQFVPQRTMSERGESSQNPSVVVDILTTQMQEGLKALPTSNDGSQPTTIFRVPPNVRNQDSLAFDPQFISIGPLHRDNKQLEPMEKQKWAYLKDLIARSHSENELPKNYIAAISSIEKEARRHYAEELSLTSQQFLEMLVLDGCFIIEYLLKYAIPVGESEERQNVPYLRTDLFRIENQVPFVVLEILFQESKIEIANTYPQDLRGLAVYFTSYGEIKEFSDKTTEVYHLLHFSHLFHSLGHDHHKPKHPCWPSSCLRWTNIKDMLSPFLVACMYFPVYILCNCRFPRDSPKRRSMNVPSAKEFWEAGVEFRRKDHGSCFSASLQDGILRIHPWRIANHTKSYFWNHIALEICSNIVGKDLFSFSVFMSYLMSTPDDVAILERSGIIGNHLGSNDDLISIFRSLRGGALPETEKSPFKELLAYYDSKPRRWRAELVHDYGDFVPNFYYNPWVKVSILAGTFFLLLSGIGSIYSILKYYQHQHP